MGNSSSARRRRAHAVQYVKPSGLYTNGKWDDRRVARLIVRGELAPRHPGADERDHLHREECPICFLAYPILNKARCCAARLCTECYLQLRAPRRSACAPCPFCKAPRLSASLKDLPSDEILRQLDENKRRSEAAAAREQNGLVRPRSMPAVCGASEGSASCDFDRELSAEFEYLLNEALKRSMLEQ